MRNPFARKLSVDAAAKKYAAASFDARSDFEAFAGIFAQAVQRLEVTKAVERQGDRLSITVHGNLKNCLANLDNFARDIQQAQTVADADDVLRSQLASLVDIVNRSSEPEGHKIEDIVPLVRSLELIRTSSEDGLHLQAYLLAGDIGIFLAEDGEHALRYLSEDDIGTLGLEPEDLLLRAQRNLHARLPEFEIHSTESSLSMLTCGGTYEASALLFDDFWERIAADFERDLVAAVPANDLLYFADSGADGALTAITQCVQDSRENVSKPISEQLLRFTEDGWAATLT